MLLLYVVADEHDRFLFAIVLECLDGVVVAEWVVVPDETCDDEVEHLADTLVRRDDLPPGIGAEPTVLRLAQLGPLLVRRCYRQGCALVSWDMPWSLGRIASHVGRSAPDGFSLGLGGACNVAGRWRDSYFLPRVTVRSRGAGLPGAFVSWAVPHDDKSRLRPGRRPGSIVDLELLCGAVCGGELAGAPHAGELLGVPWPEGPPRLLGPDDAIAIAGARVEAGALVALYGAACNALEEEAPGLAPERAWSTGSLAQHNLRLAGVLPLSAKAAGLPVEVKAAGSAAFGGGRVEAALVGVACPMALVDMHSTYPAMLSVLALTPFLACDYIEEEDVTEELRAFLESPELPDQLYRRETWAHWGLTYAVVEPRGEHLPAQVRWNPDRVGGTVAPLELAGGHLPWHWADLAASVLDGPAPKIVRAWCLVPRGRQDGLRPLRLPSGITVDLVTEDLGEALVRERIAIREDPGLSEHERRRLLSLSKLFANALCFGLFARHDRKSVASAVDHLGHGPDGSELHVRTRHPEAPGPDASLPLAGAVTAGCRLAVAMARRAMHDLGGTVALVATDAIAVPASSRGGLVACPGGPHRLDDETEAIRLLSFDDLRSVLARFDSLLAPWGHDASRPQAWSEVAGTLNKPAVGLVAGVNKLVLGRNDHPRRQRPEDRWSLVRSSDADMGGHLLDPSGTGARLDDARWWWAGEIERLVLAANAGHPTSTPLRVPPVVPAWAHEPAVRPYRAATWAQLVALRGAVGDDAAGAFAHYRRAETGRSGPAPTALGTSNDWRIGGDPVGLFVLDSDGERFVGGDSRARRRVRVLSVADHVARWLREEDPSMAGPRRGLRKAVPVFSHPALVEVVGRAGEALWAQEEEPDTVEPALSYGAPWLDDLRSTVRAQGRREVARRGQLSRHSVGTFARGGRVDTAAVEAIAATAGAPRRCQHCGEPLTGRAQRWCSKGCQKAGERTKRRNGPTTQDAGPTAHRCPICAMASTTPGHCTPCDLVFCPNCRTVLLGTARHGPCPVCGEGA